MGEVRRVGLIICLFCVLLSVDKVVDIGEIGFEIEGLMVCSASLIESWGTSIKDVAGVVVKFDLFKIFICGVIIYEHHIFD